MNTPAQIRQRIRKGEHSGPTAGLAPGFVQCNIVILPAGDAANFAAYCEANPDVAPVLMRSAPGESAIAELGRDLDIRTDLGRYRLFQGDTDSEVATLHDIWRDDLVTFALGCSFSFEDALRREGVDLRYLDRGEREVLYKTTIETKPGGGLSGPLLVSMRPLRPTEAIRAINVTSKYPGVHGAPVHIGKPEMIGVDLAAPYQALGPHTVAEDELPVFWACGVTPQLALARANPALAISHVSAHMLVTDIRLEDLEIQAPR